MKRIHMQGGGKVAIEEVPRPKPGRGEVLVRTAVSALCGSEMGAFRKEGLPSGNPGHEAAGVVEEVGEGVTAVVAGDRVGASAIAGCGECGHCRKGQYTWCAGFRFFGNMHAEYFVAAALACHKLPDHISWETGALITGDGMGVPYHTWRKCADPRFHTVAVFGLGPIGLGNVLLQAHRGRRVIGLDRSEYRLGLAREIGAAEVISAQPGMDMPSAVKNLTEGAGADVAIEAAGTPETFQAALRSVKCGGLVLLNGEQPKVELSPSDDLIRRDIGVQGSWFYHFSEFPEMLSLARNGLPVEKMITHRFSLEEAGEAYETMANGKSGKVLIHYQ